MPLSDESKNAFMRAASLLAQGRSADQRERIFRNFETYAAQGQWIPAITAAQFPILFYVSEPQRLQQLSGAIAEAQRKGELQLPSGAEPQGLLPLQWAAWEGLPPVPPDSPLIHWLPSWVKRATTESDESSHDVSSDAQRADSKGSDEWTEAEKEKMRKMRANGMSDVAIANVLGITRQRIAQIIGSKTKNRIAARGSKR